MTIFQMDRTLSTLFLSYPVSWLITALAHFICYLIVHRRFMKKAHVGAAALNRTLQAKNIYRKAPGNTVRVPFLLL